MKKVFLTSFFSLITILSFGQNESIITAKDYVTNVDIVVQKYDIFKKKSVKLDNDSAIYVALKGTKFETYEFIGEGDKEKRVLIKFWTYGKNTDYKEQIEKAYNKDTTTGKRQVKVISDSTNGTYFTMSLDDFNTKVSLYYPIRNSVVWGFSTIPIKLRFGDSKERPFLYETAFSLGVNAGYSRQIKSRNQQSWSVLAGIAVSNVPIDTADVNGFINQNITTGAVTPSISGLYSYGNFQAGLFFGYDIIPGQLGKEWRYRNSPWLGIGLGFTIFQRNRTEGKGEKKN